MSRYLLLAFVLAVVPAAALARVHPNPAAQVQIEFPDTWKVEQKGGDIVAETKAGAATFMLVTLEAGDLEAALGKLEKIIAETFTETKMGEVQEVQVNGLKGVAGGGTAKLGGRPVDLGVMMLYTPNRKVVLMLAMLASDEAKKLEKEMSGILGSLRPLPKK